MFGYSSAKKGDKMEFVELLDKINEKAPKCCDTCRHRATHKGCGSIAKPDYCLETINESKPGDPKGFIEFNYRNWEPGNWLRDLQAAELNGERNIVIGDQGEAELNVKRTPKETAKHLHYVAEQCGYSVGNLRHSEAHQKTVLDIYTDRAYKIIWDDTPGADNKVEIWVLDQTGTPSQRFWPRY
jgi:hypothetical protein